MILLLIIVYINLMSITAREISCEPALRDKRVVLSGLSDNEFCLQYKMDEKYTQVNITYLVNTWNGEKLPVFNYTDVWSNTKKCTNITSADVLARLQNTEPRIYQISTVSITGNATMEWIKCKNCQSCAAITNAATITPGATNNTATVTPGASNNTATVTPGASNNTATITPVSTNNTATVTPGASNNTATVMVLVVVVVLMVTLAVTAVYICHLKKKSSQRDSPLSAETAPVSTVVLEEHIYDEWIYGQLSAHSPTYITVYNSYDDTMNTTEQERPNNWICRYI
ncbi:uncharacterized protein [Cherax quadricarinatus]|uniref:uncharacterized protein n=1 Tax=Cherax quadricarinatus TaxID=27406 RepID=UPI00387EB08E